VADPNLDNWTDADLIDQITSLLDKGTDMVCEPGETAWEVRFERNLVAEDGSETSEVLWSGQDITMRGALFQAFAQVWTPPPTQPGDPWALRPNRPTLRAVADKLSEKYADPEDLDPVEVASVYTPDPDPSRR
jgi:hypothetical protein